MLAYDRFSILPQVTIKFRLTTLSRAFLFVERQPARGSDKAACAGHRGSSPFSGDQGIRQTRLITPFQPHWAKTLMR